MRLFAAIVPPEHVLDSIQAELHRLGPDHDREELRWAPRSRWHLTLAFYGEDDPERRAEWLAERLAGQRAVRLSIEGAGAFPGVLWVGVRGPSGPLAGAAGGDQVDRPYHPHLTLARWRGHGQQRAARHWAAELAGYRGPRWRAAEVVLMRSELSRAGPRYTVRERFGLLD
ncbi:MAG: RNA 2',3'-cyclic phosphodiesterase [Haloechinothrix sp.]